MTSHDSHALYDLCLALRHENADLQTRERYGLQAEHLVSFKAQLQSKYGISPDWVWGLITCNRCEVYIQHALDAHLQTEFVHDLYHLWADALGVPVLKLQQHLSVYKADAALYHLCEVSAGLDSMMLGETQIAHQIKLQMQQAPKFQHTLQMALQCAKDIRSQTQIAAWHVSMASIAVQLAKKLFENLQQKRLLMVGTGMMMQTLAPYFLAQNPKSIEIINRSIDGIKNFIQRFHLQGDHIQTGLMDALPQALLRADMVLICTQSPDVLIELNMLKQAMRHRQWNSMYCLDMSVPRNIAAACQKLDNVFLYTVDDIGAMAQEGRAKRYEAKMQAQEVIARHVAQFFSSRAQRQKKAVILMIQAYFKRCITHIPPMDAKGQAVLKSHYKKQQHLWLKHVGQLSLAQTQALLRDFENAMHDA